MRSSLAAAALALLLQLAPAHADGELVPAVAGPLVGGLARYEGGTVAISSGPGGNALITFVVPRPSWITRYRVTTGSLVASGLWRADRFVGEAWVFTGCGPIPFPVRGTVDQTRALVLVGTVPYCDRPPAVTVLRFVPIGLPPPPPVAAAPALPPPDQEFPTK